MENPLIRLAEHAASWRDRPLPAAVAHHARRALIDWFAALLPGCTQPPASLMAGVLADQRGTGRAICYVDGQAGALRHAALLNATASHTVEFDDIFRDAGYHPGCPTIPAALAAAQARGTDMDTLLRAMVAGYEVSCRIGLAVQPSHYRYWHTTGTVGTFGAAAAVGVVLGLDAHRMAHALATAATMAGGLQQAFRGEGMSKPLHPGHAAEAGALAALAASAGVTGALDVLHGPVGFAAATSADAGQWDKALAGLDEWVAITRMTFKNHGCCGHIFAALDGLAALQDRHGFTAEQVAALHIGGYSATKDVCDRPVVATEQQARFSAQYCAGALLVLGGVRLAAFAPANLANPRIHAMMEKVTVSLDPALAQDYPARRAANLRLELVDGRVLEHHQPTRKGDPDAPLSDAELAAKFYELAVPAIGATAAEALLDLLRHGAALPGALPLAAQRLEPAS
ncbi:MmgE/PrpD family protein [Falsiroseomonas selenitidurans]|uniref:MmgE/PrpD family protein n=1 Tax=Falsiroseomonas selenitidurans TaxID=2716335 RepID=A0ABX1E174_9PROT|nr:MmgE/PrpD family protein [Falsiroseomonas selenitidurans]NKC30801.1 MmgE/PrpD family protein [Falsiroseomonas selenitidurans]